MGELAFIKIPPPKPSHARNVAPAPYGAASNAKQPAYVPGSIAAAASQAPIDMSAMIDRGGGCFTGDSIVLLANGAKRIRHVRRGDVLRNGAVVTHVVRFGVARRTICSLNSCVGITPYHPILVLGEWQFPISHFDLQYEIGHVYNLILDKIHMVEFAGHVIACTLGHGFQNNTVISHQYFGNMGAIKQDFKRVDPVGFKVGLVRVESSIEWKRDGTGKVVGMNF